MIVACPQCRRKNRLPNTAATVREPVCGNCGAALPTTPPRGSRLGRFLANSVLALDGLFLLLLAVFCFFDVIGPERWWLTGFLLYMPRWGWAVGAAALLLPTIGIAAPRRGAGPYRRRWKMTFTLTAALGWIVGPLMGLNVPLRLPSLLSLTSPSSAETRLRVMTYNVKWGLRNPQEIVREIERSNPDLIQMQDSGEILSGVVGQLLTPQNGWTVRRDGQYVVASRWPLSDLSPIDLSAPHSRFEAVRATLTPPGGGQPVTLFNVHLLSARYGLLAVRQRDSAFLKENITERLGEANRLALAVVNRPRGPVLLTGDLNSPPTSLVKRRLREIGLRDAFQAAGTGYGYTYGQSTKIRRPYVRIDCILTSPDIRADTIRVGNTIGSDHSPVIADLSLPR